nr:putative capsid [Marmot picobirnavirus]
MAKSASNRKGNRSRRNFGTSKSSKFTETKVTQRWQGDKPHVITNSSSDNDEEWYTHIYPAVDSLASFPYSIPVGTTFDPVYAGEQWTALATGQVVPGALILEVAPTVGICDSPTAAPNLAAQQLYSLTRKQNSGRVNYDKTDEMMVIMAMDSAYMLYEQLLRVYRLMGTYSTMNRYQPKAIVQALGFEYDMLNRNLADFRGILDLFAYQLGSINIPDQFSFIRRHSWLFTNVYKDSEDEKAQLYMFRCAGLYVWTEGEGESPTYLRYTQMSTLFGTQDNVNSLDQVQSAINKIMQPLLGSEDVGVISGDIAKAFGDGGMIQIQPVNQYEALTPVYSAEVLQQIMNATVIEGALSDMNIETDYSNLKAGPFIIHQPKVTFNNMGWLTTIRKRLINVRHGNVTPGQNMVFTRLICDFATPSKPIASSTIIPIQTCGTEIVLGMRVVTFGGMSDADPNPANPVPLTTRVSQDISENGPSGQFAEADVRYTALLSAFDNHPTVYVWGISGSGDESTFQYQLQNYFQDLNQYTWIDKSTVKQLNDVALLSEFSVKDFNMTVTR